MIDNYILLLAPGGCFLFAFIGLYLYFKYLHKDK